MANYSLNYSFGNTKCVSLPQSLRLLGQMVLLDVNVFPTRHRDAIKLGGDNPIFQGLLESAEQRTRRLFSSFDELDREVWGSASQPSISTSQSKTDADPCWYSLHSFGALEEHTRESAQRTSPRQRYNRRVQGSSKTWIGT